MALPSVLSYKDYRSFLKDYYNERKAADPGFSFRHFAKICDLGSGNYLKLVMDGERSLTVDNIHRFARGLELERYETAYFEALVHWEQCKSSEAKEFYKDRLEELSRHQTPKRLRFASERRFLESPHFGYVLLAAHKTPRAHAKKSIATRLHLALDDVSELVDRLLDLGLLLDKDGLLEMAGDHYIYHDRLPTSRQKLLLKNQLKMSMQALDQDKSDFARFFCTSLTMSSAAFPSAVDQIQEFLSKLVAAHHDEAPELITQFNVQLFAVDRIR